MKRPLGYDVDDNAIRFSNYFHVLRELVHFTNGWMPLEPSLERKYALGDHVHDDARALTKIKRRLYELRNPSEYPGSPSPELERLLDRMAQAESAQEYLTVAYTEAKPALARAMRIHLDNLDPVADEPSLRLLTQIVERQERHTDGHGGFDADIGALPVRLREARASCDPPPARRAGARRLRGGDRAGRPVPLTRAVRERRGEPRADRAGGAAALLPRPDGRRAERGRADGPQLARAPRAAVGLPRGHGAPELGRGAPREAARPPDEGAARLRLGRLPGRLLLLQVDLRLRPARPALPLQRHERAAGDVAALTPAQEADGAGPGARGARVRLPAG